MAEIPGDIVLASRRAARARHCAHPFDGDPLCPLCGAHTSWEQLARVVLAHDGARPHGKAIGRSLADPPALAVLASLRLRLEVDRLGA